MKVAITPTTYALAFKVTDEFDSAELLTSDKPLSAITGSTQGIRFKIKPPKKAKIIAVNNDIPETVSATTVSLSCSTS